MKIHSPVLNSSLRVVEETGEKMALIEALQWREYE